MRELYIYVTIVSLAVMDGEISRLQRGLAKELNLSSVQHGSLGNVVTDQLYPLPVIEIKWVALFQTVGLYLDLGNKHNHPTYAFESRNLRGGLQAGRLICVLTRGHAVLSLLASFSSHP